MRSAEAHGLKEGRGGLDPAWVALVLLNLVAIAVWPSWDTVPFHLISTGFAVLYGLRLWPADPVHWGLGIVIITTFAGIGLDLLHDNQSVEEAAEIPLLAAMFVAIVWHANSRIAADRERQLIGEKNSRLLEAQRRFLQDASHHLRTPITIALTHAELLARDLDGRGAARHADGAGRDHQAAPAEPASSTGSVPAPTRTGPGGPGSGSPWCARSPTRTAGRRASAACQGRAASSRSRCRTPRPGKPRREARTPPRR